MANLHYNLKTNMAAIVNKAYWKPNQKSVYMKFLRLRRHLVSHCDVYAKYLESLHASALEISMVNHVSQS